MNTKTLSTSRYNSTNTAVSTVVEYLVVAGGAGGGYSGGGGGGAGGFRAGTE